MNQLQIRMFGEFSLQFGKNRISDQDGRSKKVWHLLAYLICRRSRVVTPAELIETIWGSEPASDNPENTLKVTLHRARSLLDRLWEGAGHTLILRVAGGYQWNSQIPAFLDAQQFETYCTGTPDFSAAAEALALYRREFLPRLSSGTWVIPIATHYQNLYIRTVHTVVPELLAQGKSREAADICRAALLSEPYDEVICQHLMRSLMDMDDAKGAAAAYDELSSRLLHDFGVTPNSETRALYREVTHTVQDRTMPIETVLDHLLEAEPAEGALLCSFEAFRILCYTEARAMVRSGKATHVALFSVTGQGSKILTKRSLETAMDNLSQQIRRNLRRGDTYCKCSSSQFVIMLPQANYENSCVACRRVIGAFERRYPHSPIRIHYMVRPLSTENLE